FWTQITTNESDSPSLHDALPILRGGEPGAASGWNIRGVGSLSGSSSPLVLVDGVEIDINSVDPETIESISVLKDASASAVYGSRDRKSTRLNSSHVKISYAVFCL